MTDPASFPPLPARPDGRPRVAPASATTERRRGRGGIYLALAGFVLVVVTAGIWSAGAAPDAEMGVLEGSISTVGLCMVIAGLSYWGYARSSRWLERRLAKDLAGRERLSPSEEEERALGAAIEESILNPRVVWTLSLLPTDVRQAELSVPFDARAVREQVRGAFEAEGAAILEDREDLLRGWWKVGGLNGCPAIVAVGLGPAPLGATRVTIRGVSKYWATNRLIAQGVVDRMVASLGARPPAAQAVG